MEIQWSQVAHTFRQAKKQVEKQRQEYYENRTDSDRTEICDAKLRIKPGLDRSRQTRTQSEVVTRVLQNKLLPPLNNTSLPSYNKNNINAKIPISKKLKSGGI